MVICEMCGKEVGRGIRIRVDKAVLVVGPECTRFGVLIDAPQRPVKSAVRPAVSKAPVKTRSAAAVPQKRASRENDPLERQGTELASDYPKRILRARNALGFNQEELAAKLNEKRSVIRELESGSLVPSDSLVRKLEKQLKISLREAVSQDYKLPSVKRKELTLGDLMKE